jgi:hypothetical protein
MAISGGTLAAVLGALGVGGFVLWRRAQAQQKSTCQSLVGAAGSIAGKLGYTLNESLASSLCGVASNLDQLGSTIHQALGGKEQRTGSCPAGSTLSLDSLADHRGVTDPSKQEVGGACIDAKGRIVGTLGINGYTPYAPTSGAVVVPVNSPTNTTTTLSRDGRARGGVTVT